MLAFLLAWAIMGSTNAKEAPVQSAATAVLREWTDASGTRRARAALVRIEANKLWLRRSDGKLTTVTLAQLSESDRQFVANNPIGPTRKTPQELPKRSLASQLEIKGRLIPAALVYVRVSRDFLADYADRTVSRRKPVHDYILGTRIVGQSDTRGKTHLELMPSSGRLSGKISFEGTVHARTRGFNGPVVLNQTSDSTFRASKLITLDESGLCIAPAATTAPTNLRTTSIDTSLPGLRGRIARRIAWGRVSDRHQKAESITAQRTAANISRDFDNRINESVAKVKEVFKSKFPDLEIDREPMRAEMRFRSNTDSVEIAMVRRSASQEERGLRPPAVIGNPDVAVRVHQALLRPRDR